MQPLPNTVSEEKAEPEIVDYPEQETIEELPAETTEADGIVDTGFTWDQSYPGDTQSMPEQGATRLLANRVTIVSDNLVFGSAILGPDEPPFQLVPAHRDRLRVTIQVVQADGEPDVFIGSERNIAPTQNGWLMQSEPLVLETRGVVYATSVGGAGTVRIQYAIELVSE